MKWIGLFVLNSVMPFTIFSQAVPTDGYIIKVRDTIFCRILFDSHRSFLKTSLVVMIDDSAIEYRPGEPVHSFGIRQKDSTLHYGAVRMYDGNRTRKIFIRKIVTGEVELFEHIYNILRTVRGTTISASEHHEDYYIARTSQGLEPKLHRSFNMRTLRKYIPEFIDSEDKRKNLDLKQLISVLNEFNQWYKSKQRN